MVRDYETPMVPPTWQAFARTWADRLGLANKNVSLICSPDRYGIPVVLRLIDQQGRERIATRRASDADDAAERRQAFLEALRSGDFQTIEIDVAGYYVSEGTVPCGLCEDAPRHEEWQHLIVRELVRVADPPPEPEGPLSPEDADEAELQTLNRTVAEQLMAAR